MAKKVTGWLSSVVLVLVLYLFLWPVPIHPVAWGPHPAPALEGDFAENRVLQGMELFATPNSHGPEDVAVDAEGRVYVGVGFAVLGIGGVRLSAVGLGGQGLARVRFAVLCVFRIHRNLPLQPNTIYTDMQELC